MKGVLYILPADPMPKPKRREITAPPTAEELHEIVGGYIELVPGFDSIEFTTLDRTPEVHACVAFCNEDGKRLKLPMNRMATVRWNDALVRTGNGGLMLPQSQGGGLADYLVGNVAVIWGDDELMADL
jgi:hypothetical protein